MVKAQYGDWQMSCDTPPGASFEQCAIIQNVTAEDQPNVGLSVIVLKTADQQARLLRVLAPLGVLLPNGLGLNVDGTDMGRVAFVRCLPNGCVAEVVMDDALLKQLSEGKNAIFVVFKTPEEGIGIPVSLNGFGDGFEQAAVIRLAADRFPPRQLSSFGRPHGAHSRGLIVFNDGALRRIEMHRFVNCQPGRRRPAFMVDTTVHPAFQRQGIATSSRQAATLARARAHWLHVDCEPHLEGSTAPAASSDRRRH